MRGLEPSTPNGPFTIAQAVEDALAVLDGLRWERVLAVGRSWGGQLALRLAADTDRLAAALAATAVPYGVLAGGASPMPWGQATRATVELSPRAFLKVVPGGGHFPWLDEPGCVRAAVMRLAPAPAGA